MLGVELEAVPRAVGKKLSVRFLTFGVVTPFRKAKPHLKGHTPGSANEGSESMP